MHPPSPSLSLLSLAQLALWRKYRRAGNRSFSLNYLQFCFLGGVAAMSSNWPEGCGTGSCMQISDCESYFPPILFVFFLEGNGVWWGEVDGHSVLTNNGFAEDTEDTEDMIRNTIRKLLMIWIGVWSGHAVFEEIGVCFFPWTCSLQYVCSPCLVV